ncbi:MAG: flagella basal body P-ring formation protein FlgA [Vallitalea sp.]|jgi:hypothetical protein|nr:flagella basal body P-ring formation protein FlgA [Vallitalea sp.]
MKNFFKGLLGIVLIIIAIGIIFYWEVHGRENLLYKDIVVLTQEINKNEVITKDMLQYQKREESTLIKEVITKKEIIIGKAANNYIPKGVQLVEKYFEDPCLVLDEDEYIFKIPGEWIMAFPNSLRRGDKIYFYEIDKNRKSETIDVDGDIPMYIEEALEEDAIVNTTVAYVKDGANREVVSLSDEERFNGTSRISEIEIITDLEIVNLLRESIKQDKVFIIMYK